MDADRLRERLNRVGRVGVHAPVALFVSAVGGRHHVARIVELGHHAVRRQARRLSHAALSSLISASGTSVRISKIEITGRNLRKRSIRKKKNPIVPKNIVKSKMVGEYMPHDEGRKSRWRLIGMMMKRSS